MFIDEAPRPTRSAPSELLRSTKIVAVLRADDAKKYLPVLKVLVAEGIRCLELTLTTPGTLEELPDIISQLGSDAEVGVGTVCTPAQATRAIAAGAHYLVTPAMFPGVIETAVTAGVPVYPGGLTPTELRQGWDLGATAVKIFPAETVGPQFGSHLRGPFPDMQFMPSGGINLEDIPAWLRAGALAVSLGGPLIGDALRGGSLSSLAERAALALAATEVEAR